MATQLRMPLGQNNVILNEIDYLLNCLSRLSFTVLLMDVIKCIVNLNSPSNEWIDQSVFTYLKCSYFIDGKLNRSTYCVTLIF